MLLNESNVDISDYPQMFRFYSSLFSFVQCIRDKKEAGMENNNFFSCNLEIYEIFTSKKYLHRLIQNG